MTDDFFPTQPVDDEEMEEELFDEEEFDIPDPASVVTIRSTGGGVRYIPVSEPTAASELLQQAGLYVNGNIQYWLNGAQVSSDTLIPAGQTLMVVGSVKGA